jgi:nitrilase
MTEHKRKIAAIQMASGSNIDANLLEVEKQVSAAVAAGAELVVLPENFAFLGKVESELCALREQEGNGPLQQFLSQLAKRHSIWIVGGTVPLVAKDPDKICAACLIFNDAGEQVGRYDKIHLFDVHLIETDEKYAESKTIEAGKEAVVIDSPFGRLGIAVCYDLRFPEMFRKMVDMGVELICLPAAFTAITGKAHWEPLVRARAIENLAYVVAAAQGGFHVSGRETYGHSMIVNQWGAILDQLPQGGGFVIAELDLEHLASTRRTFPALQHRHINCD